MIFAAYCFFSQVIATHFSSFGFAFSVGLAGLTV
jgi:hypothetical protein